MANENDYGLDDEVLDIEARLEEMHDSDVRSGQRNPGINIVPARESSGRVDIKWNKTPKKTGTDKKYGEMDGLAKKFSHSMCLDNANPIEAAIYMLGALFHPDKYIHGIERGFEKRLAGLKVHQERQTHLLSELERLQDSNLFGLYEQSLNNLHKYSQLAANAQDRLVQIQQYKATIEDRLQGMDPNSLDEIEVYDRLKRVYFGILKQENKERIQKSVSSVGARLASNSEHECERIIKGPMYVAQKAGGISVVVIEELISNVEALYPLYLKMLQLYDDIFEGGRSVQDLNQCSNELGGIINEMTYIVDEKMENFEGKGQGRQAIGHASRQSSGLAQDGYQRQGQPGRGGNSPAGREGLDRQQRSESYMAPDEDPLDQKPAYAWNKRADGMQKK